MISNIFIYTQNIIDNIGFLGPFILLISSIWLLKNKSTLLTYYITGYILNIGLNIILKYLLKQPRPSENLKLFNIYINQGKVINFNKYGMPSGHAQNVFYSVTFILFALQNLNITSIYLLIAILTSYQRIKYNMHTLSQIICGSVIGLLFGYLSYIVSLKKITGILNYKKDDNALHNIGNYK